MPGSGGSSQQLLSQPPGSLAEGGPSVAASAFTARSSVLCLYHEERVFSSTGIASHFDDRMEFENHNDVFLLREEAILL